MNVVTEGSVSDVPYRVEDPERVPAERYYDKKFYQLECERLWPHVWQMACRLEQIPTIGDWVEYSHLGQSVIVVHAKDGVRAFHNSCRHRGVKLADGGHGNCKTQGFICPFHGWRWNMDGKNTFVYGKDLFSERQLDPEDIDLVPCRFEVAIGCVFINFDDNAPSFRDSIGPLVDRLDAHGVERLRTEWWRATVVPANWKLTMEAFFEGYHAMRTHPELCRASHAAYQDMYGSKKRHVEGNLSEAHAPKRGVSAREAVNATFRVLEATSQGMMGLVHSKELDIARRLLDIDLPENPAEAVAFWFSTLRETITKDLRARGEPVPDLQSVAASDPLVDVEFLFPNFYMLSYFSSFISYRIRPLGPETCLFEIWSLTMYPEGQEPAPLMEPKMLPYDSEEFPLIARQDYANIPRQQLGVHSKGFKFMRLSRDVEGMISNFERLVDSYLTGAPAEQRVTENHRLAGNFDGQIEDLVAAE